MNIQLSDHFSYSKLFKFVLPSICMMVFTSIYSVVDGFFVSNYVGKTPFAALNLIYPLVQIIASLGFMLGAGGSAIVGKTLGEGDNEKANKYFSMLVIATTVIAIVASAVTIPFLKPLSVLMGADESMVEHCVTYATILLIGMLPFMLQNLFQALMITAQKPHLGFVVTVFAGCTNMFLDYLMVGVMRLGLAGAAWATVISEIVGGIIPLIYFLMQNSSLLRIGKTKFYGKVFFGACVNGSSELVSNISASIVAILYNKKLMEYAGQNGVSAYGVFMYVSFVFLAIFIGYAIGSAPIVSYHYGAKNYDELKNLFRKGITVNAIFGIIMLCLGEVTAVPLGKLFVGYDAELLEMTCRCFYIGSVCYLFAGTNIFASSFFTALNNGIVSAMISFMRTLVFQVSTVLLLPLVWKLDGVWMSITAADILAFCVTLFFLIKLRKKYHYA